MSKDRSPIRLTILGGFLGAGKTTWLRHQIRGGVFADAFIIVNEAADSPVDHALLSDSRRLAVLAGGCACCAGRPALLAMLKEIHSQLSESEAPSRIVLETSGLADPAPIVEAIRVNPELSSRIVVSEVIVAVDALHAQDRLREEWLARSQIASADCIIVTKVEAGELSALGRLVATLRFLNPRAPIFGAAQGVETALPPDDEVEPEIFVQDANSANAPAIFATTLEIDETIDWTALTLWLSALLHAHGDDVIRVKGVVKAPAGRLLIQIVGRVVQTPQILPDEPTVGPSMDNQLVIIGRGYRPDDLKKSLRFFARQI